MNTQNAPLSDVSRGLAACHAASGPTACALDDSTAPSPEGASSAAEGGASGSHPKTRWTAERVARLGFLVGQGWDAKRVAGDPLIASTSNNVHRQAQRFGLAFRDTPPALFRLPGEAGALYDAAATKRGLTREGLIHVLLLTAAADTGLIDNILDDGL